MRLLDLLGDDDETPESTPIPATFLATPAPAPDEEDGPLLPSAMRNPTPRPAPAFAPPPSQPRPAHAPKVIEPRRPALWFGMNPRTAGLELGEAVAETWHTSGGSSDIEIPVSIVAALALFPIKDHTEDVRRIISTCTDWQLIQGYREIWVNHWSARPDLIAHAAPLIGWLSDDRAQKLVYPVRRVTETALRYGVLDLTGSSDPGDRSDTDLMSWTITSLRSEAARKGQAEFHTPPEVADMMARLTVDQDSLPEPGAWFNELTAGTGGLMRALAQRLRELDRNPANYGWSMTDTDPLAIAGAAVNSIVWGLGPNVLISCANTLAEGNTDAKAAERRAALIEERDELVSRIECVTAFHEAITLADRLIKGTAA